MGWEVDYLWLLVCRRDRACPVATASHALKGHFPFPMTLVIGIHLPNIFQQFIPTPSLFC